MTRLDSEERLNRILDASAELFIHYGFDKTTVSDIARTAGISKGAIYLHVNSKDELFEAVLLREMQTYAERWLALVEADPQGGTLAGLYKNMLYALSDSPFMAAAFKQDRRILGSYLRKPDNPFRNGISGSPRLDFVTQMQNAGAIRTDIAPEVITHIMNMLAYGLVAMDDIMDPSAIPPTEAVIEGIATFMDRALTPENGGDSEAGKAIVRQIFETTRQQFEQRPLAQPN